MFLPNPAAWVAMETIRHVPASQAPGQILQAQLLGLDIIDMWLQASRRLMDGWRIAARSQQDAFLAAWGSQVERALLGAAETTVVEDLVPAHNPSRSPPKSYSSESAQAANAA